MELLAVVAAVAVIWILAKRSSVSTPAASKQPNELDQIYEQQLAPPPGSYAGDAANYQQGAGRTSTELEAIEQDAGSLADYEPAAQLFGNTDLNPRTGLPTGTSTPWPIELPLAPPRPN